MFSHDFHPSELFPDAFWPKSNYMTAVVSDGLIQIEYRYSNGDLLSSDPEDAAVVDIDAPGYVSGPREFVGGVLTLRPIGVGTATVEVTYTDPDDGLKTVARPITVVPQ